MRALSVVRNTINRTSLSILPVRRYRFPYRSCFRPLHTFSCHQPLWDAYESHIPLKDRYCLHQLEIDWAERKPLKGKVVLVNVHLTRITLALITALLKSGARVEVTVSPELVIHQNALQAVLAAKIPFLQDIPDEKKQGYYNIVFNCGGGMKDIIPRGMVELTCTSPEIYNKKPFPVITVDSSKTKSIETGLGTGDSFVRVIHHLVQQSIIALVLNWKLLDVNSPHHSLYLTTLLNLIDVNQLFSKNKFMVFGFGKVGKGIASALENAGVPKKNIFVVDISSEAYMEAMKQGYSSLLLKDRDPESSEKIKKVLLNIWAVVTAMGIEGAISQHFSQSDFDSVAVLANMSTNDDFGSHFSTQRILNGKKLANFILDEPTQVKYLDPIFALFLMAGEELLTNPALKNGLNTISPSLDQAVLTNWLNQQGDSIWTHWSGQTKTETFIQYLRRSSALPLPELTRWVNSQRIFNQTLTPQPSCDLKHKLEC